MLYQAKTKKKLCSPTNIKLLDWLLWQLFGSCGCSLHLHVKHMPRTPNLFVHYYLDPTLSSIGRSLTGSYPFTTLRISLMVNYWVLTFIRKLNSVKKVCNCSWTCWFTWSINNWLHFSNKELEWANAPSFLWATTIVFWCQSNQKLLD